MKAIYKPEGKAGEYAEYACNFYTGCSNDCQYCYLKRGVLSHVWSTTPTLKKAFKDVTDAQMAFTREIDSNLEEIRTKGLFFTFSSDPFLKETKDLNLWAIQQANMRGVPVTVLTKRAECVDYLTPLVLKRELIAVGFTLTGADMLEPGASANEERIFAMKKAKDCGFRTWASVEPIITTQRLVSVIEPSERFCDLYKIGLRCGVGNQYYFEGEIRKIYDWLKERNGNYFLKKSFVEYLNLDKLEKPFVDKDFNIFSI